MVWNHFVPKTKMVASVATQFTLHYFARLNMFFSVFADFLANDIFEYCEYFYEYWKHTSPWNVEWRIVQNYNFENAGKCPSFEKNRFEESLGGCFKVTTVPSSQYYAFETHMRLRFANLCYHLFGVLLLYDSTPKRRACCPKSPYLRHRTGARQHVVTRIYHCDRLTNHVCVWVARCKCVFANVCMRMGCVWLHVLLGTQMMIRNEK